MVAQHLYTWCLCTFLFNRVKCSLLISCGDSQLSQLAAHRCVSLRNGIKWKMQRLDLKVSFSFLVKQSILPMSYCRWCCFIMLTFSREQPKLHRNKMMSKCQTHHRFLSDTCWQKLAPPVRRNLADRLRPSLVVAAAVPQSGLDGAATPPPLL